MRSLKSLARHAALALLVVLSVLLVVIGLLMATGLLPVVAGAAFGDEAAQGADQLFEWLQRAPPALLSAVVIIAPLFGVPLSALLVVMGLALPAPLALSVTVLALVIHHLLMYALSHTRAALWLRRELCKRKLLAEDRSDHSFASDILFLLTATWAPGVSYIFKLAVVALAGLPTSTYFIFGILCQLTAAIPYLLLGEVAQEVGFGQLTLLIFATLIAVWGFRYTVSRRRTAAAPEKQSS